MRKEGMMEGGFNRKKGGDGGEVWYERKEEVNGGKNE